MAEQTKITGGVVRFSMRLCPKQYEHKESNVDLTFTVGETDDYEAVFDRASRAVVNRVRQMVDLPPLAAENKPAVVAKAKETTGLFND